MSFVLLLTVPLVHAQNWRVYSQPQGGFSVETPAPLRKVISFDGEHGASLEPDQKIGWASCYAAIETTADDSRFGIIVINGRAKFLRTQPQDELLWHLGAILIGDDDDPEPKIKRVIHTNGLVGKEYFYIRADFCNTGDIHTRGRIFDTGDKIYLVVFAGQSIKDLVSPDAERFLNSFRLRRVKL